MSILNKFFSIFTPPESPSKSSLFNDADTSFKNMAPFIDNGSIIKIKYKSGSKETVRDIKIKEITDDKVKAFCMLRNTLRTFKIDNIIEWSPSDNFKLKGRIAKELFEDKFMKK